MDLLLGDRAHDVPAGGGGGAGALQRQPRLGGVELRGGGVEDDGEVAELDVELALQALARVLELGEDALGVVRVALVVAGDERLGGGLEPGHSPDGARLTSTVKSSSGGPMRSATRAPGRFCEHQTAQPSGSPV